MDSAVGLVREVLTSFVKDPMTSEEQYLKIEARKASKRVVRQ